MADGSVTIDTKLDDKGFKSGLGKLGGIAKAGLAGVTAVTGAVSAGFVTMTTEAVKSYASFEQLEGGIESVFGGIEKGQEQISKVQKYAETAWKDLTMSQSDYYSTFTSTYPLMKNSIEDQNEAIEKTNRLMTLESDLANTFGYSTENAANAINWALKGTFSYLDNLNIGIAGTQEGFLEAAKNCGYTVDNVKELGSSEILDILEQTANQYGVLGKTADEAGTTISGSISSLKGAFDNFLNGSGGINEVVASAEVVINNVVAVVERLLPQIMDSLVQGLPKLLETGGRLLSTIIDGIVQYMPQIAQMSFTIIKTLAENLMNNLPQIIQTGVDILMFLIDSFADNIDKVIDLSIQLITALAEGLIDALPKLIDKVPYIIQKICEALIRNFPRIFTMGGELLSMLVRGILSVTASISDAFIRIFTIIKSTIGVMIKNIPRYGKNLIQGFVQGIVDNAQSVIESVTIIVTNLVNTVKDFLGIHSPSTVFERNWWKFNRRIMEWY